MYVTLLLGSRLAFKTYKVSYLLITKIENKQT